jgi:hypothetical protein
MPFSCMYTLHTLDNSVETQDAGANTSAPSIWLKVPDAAYVTVHLEHLTARRGESIWLAHSRQSLKYHHPNFSQHGHTGSCCRNCTQNLRWRDSSHSRRNSGYEFRENTR